MKWLSMIFICLFISGCGANITPERFAIASKFCESNGGLNHIGTIGTFLSEDLDISVYCNNGLSTNLDKIRQILKFNEEVKDVQD